MKEYRISRWIRVLFSAASPLIIIAGIAALGEVPEINLSDSIIPIIFEILPSVFLIIVFTVSWINILLFKYLVNSSSITWIRLSGIRKLMLFEIAGFVETDPSGKLLIIPKNFRRKEITISTHTENFPQLDYWIRIHLEDLGSNMTDEE